MAIVPRVGNYADIEFDNFNLGDLDRLDYIKFCYGYWLYVLILACVLHADLEPPPVSGWQPN
ncbi:hypothetical protein KR51_00029400 [Rubidibacter lacunae KORDI 51-2]|uniref:Uncharacterized protein n=1 Tax=Rubidibacter lacunae KORDI 51-2 TaxID=582515 RepID=U5DGI9_9CHRO|nr:hypothetical protein [Rubidibacter lacunae]ERN40402.1 hypothetical protein KR51_00029400 [Rubidibacter lacunae KORDI 51-2]